MEEGLQLAHPILRALPQMQKEVLVARPDTIMITFVIIFRKID